MEGGKVARWRGGEVARSVCDVIGLLRRLAGWALWHRSRPFDRSTVCRWFELLNRSLPLSISPTPTYLTRMQTRNAGHLSLVLRTNHVRIVSLSFSVASWPLLSLVMVLVWCDPAHAQRVQPPVHLTRGTDADVRDGGTGEGIDPLALNRAPGTTHFSTIVMAPSSAARLPPGTTGAGTH